MFSPPLNYDDAVCDSVACGTLLTASFINLSVRLRLLCNSRCSSWSSRIGVVETNDAKTRGVEYRVNPQLLRDSDFKGKTTPKRIEPHRLRELILEDLKLYGPTSIKDINVRIGEEINIRSIQRLLKGLIEEGLVEAIGATNTLRYNLRQIKSNKVQFYPNL